MFTNVTDFHCDEDSYVVDSWVSFKVEEENVQLTAYTCDDAYVLSPDENGVYKFYVSNGEGVFVTVDTVDSVAE